MSAGSHIPAAENSCAVVAIDAGDLAFGGGFLALLRPALALLAPGAILTVNSSDSSAGEDLERWCSVHEHEYEGYLDRGDYAVHRLRRGRYPQLVALGASSEVAAPAMLEAERGSEAKILGLTNAEFLRAAPFPREAPVSSGFAPRGALVEQGGPQYPFGLTAQRHVGVPEIGRLLDQAARGQWSAADLPWTSAKPLAPVLERALAQVLTFLAENELAALYVPTRFMAQVHPAYAEIPMYLATQIADEARHIEVFLKRIRVCGSSPGIAAVETSQSLKSLLETRDFLESSFLLSVLGEGTFLDLLKFIEIHAPDALTAEIMRRVHADEARHVYFGMAHVAHALEEDPGLYDQLEAAVRRRATTMAQFSGAPETLQDGLTILAAGSAAPSAVARGQEKYRELLQTMHENRSKRLLSAGLTAAQAESLSRLHTPNFM